MKILAELTREVGIGGYRLILIRLDNPHEATVITEIVGDLKEISQYFTDEWKITIQPLGNNANDVTLWVDLIQKGD